MAALVYPFLALSAVGFAAMLVVHVASLFGIRAPFDHFLTYLAAGVFVVFLPTILVMNQLTRDFKQKDIWRAALRGWVPDGLRRVRCPCCAVKPEHGQVRISPSRRSTTLA